MKSYDLQRIDLPAVSCIYSINNIVSGKRYVGSAVNLKARVNLHKVNLRKDTHHSPHLQHCFNKLGIESFKVELLEEVPDKNELTKKEQWYLDLYKSYDPATGYNICKKAHSTIGTKRDEKFRLERTGPNNPFYGKKHNPETKLKMSGVNNGFYGKSHTSEVLLRASTKKVSLSQDHVLEMRVLRDSGLSYQKLGLLFNCGASTAKNAVLGKGLVYGSYK